MGCTKHEFTPGETLPAAKVNEIQDAIIALEDGTNPAGDSAKLGGKDASEYITTDGGTVNGNLIAEKTNATNAEFRAKNTLQDICLSASDGGNAGLYSYTFGKWLARFGPSGLGFFDGTASGNIKYTDKPTGTYTGNGDASNFRMVATGGIGDGCIVRSSNGVAIVTGSCVSILSSNSAVTDNSATWQNGELGMFSSHPALNASGVAYTYHVY